MAYTQHVSFIITMESQSMEKPYSMRFVIKEHQTAMKPVVKGQSEDVHMIFDYKDKKYITLINSNGQKIGMVAPLDESKNESDTANSDIKVTKTSEQKEINGYSCTKFIIKNNDMNSTVWTTTEIEYSFSDIFRVIQNLNNGKSEENRFVDNHSEVEGFPIEIIAKNKKGKDSMKMLISDIKTENIDDSLFNMEGYQMIDAATIMK